MTRKDYIKISDTLIDSFKDCYGLELNDMLYIHRLYVNKFCDMLKSDNSRFDINKFKEYIEKKGKIMCARELL